MPEERDRLLDTRLRASRADGVSSPSGNCLDPETAAAWADGMLVGDELLAARGHVADCARCQALMSTLLKAESAAGRQPSTTPAERSPLAWRRLWTRTVPLATAATVLVAAALWLRTPQAPVVAPDRAASRRGVAAAPTPAAPPLAAPDAVSGLQPNRAVTAPPRQRLAPAPSASGRAEAVDALTPPPAPSNAPSDRAASSPAASAAAPPEVSGNSTMFRAAQPQAAAAAKTRAESAVRALEVASPDPKVRWRIAGGRVQKTSDAAATWHEALPEAAIEAGAAPSPTTCWLVGASGLVLLTTDGSNWTRVAAPDSVDLTGVTATDARTATVAAADGRRFQTRDGGASWTPVDRP